MFTAVHVDGSRILLPENNVISTVHVPLKTFVNDAVRCFRDDKCIQRQVEIDCPRSHVEVDGVRVHDQIPSIPSCLLLFCTQVVMGMPIEMLHRAGSIPFEPTFDKALRVRIVSDTSEVIAYKNIDMCTENNDVVPIQICLHALNDDVRIDFVPR